MLRKTPVIASPSATLATAHSQPSQANGIGAVIRSVAQHVAMQAYRENVYQIFEAIDDYLIDHAQNDVTVPAATLYVINAINNPPPNIEPVVTFTSSMDDIFDCARQYKANPADSFTPYHNTIKELVNQYDRHLPYVRQQMSRLITKPNVVEGIALNQSAEAWGQAYEGQIKKRIREFY